MSSPSSPRKGQHHSQLKYQNKTVLGNRRRVLKTTRPLSKISSGFGARHELAPSPQTMLTPAVLRSTPFFFFGGPSGTACNKKCPQHCLGGGDAVTTRKRNGVSSLPGLTSLSFSSSESECNYGGVCGRVWFCGCVSVALRPSWHNACGNGVADYAKTHQIKSEDSFCTSVAASSILFFVVRPPAESPRGLRPRLFS